MLYEIHDITRFEKVQYFTSYARLVQRVLAPRCVARGIDAEGHGAKKNQPER